MKFVKISSAIIGFLMIVQWAFFILSGNIPEFKTTPISISFHISVELLAALLLIFGALVCKKRVMRETILLYGQGMLGYTVINSAGYFAQSGEWLFVGMFVILLAVSIFNSVQLFKQREH